MTVAVRNHVNDQPPGYGSDTLLIRWTGLDEDDTGDWIKVPAHTDMTVHVYGTFGSGGSLSIQGSNELGAPTAPIIINDSRGEGNPMTFTSADIRQVLEAPYQIRPIVTAGEAAVTSLTVAVTFRRRG
jgi:hypothetical protein